MFAEEGSGSQWNRRGAGDMRPWCLTGTHLASGEAPHMLRTRGAALLCIAAHAMPRLHLCL